MISFELSHHVKTAAKTLVLAALVAPAASFTQPPLESLSDQELKSLSIEEERLFAEVEQELSANGPYSENLIGLLTELSFQYEEVGADALAEETIERILSLVRANYGFSSLEQAPLIDRLIGAEAARGNVAATWELEQELVKLAQRNPDDLRSARILRDMGDRRMAVLRRYDAGEFPEEIVLGCFYDDSAVQQQAARRGSRPMYVVKSLDPSYSIGPETRNCGAGDRNQARRSIVASARWYYSQAANAFRRLGEHESNDLPEVLEALVYTSYLFTNPGLGAQSLRSLLEYHTTYTEAVLPRIETLVQIADWDLLYANDLGTRFEDSALEAYRQAYELLLEHGIAQASIDEIFSPETPIVLPAFVRSPLVSTETPESTGYIDVAFVVAEDGKSKRIEVLDTTTDVPRAAERDLVQTIKFSRFRPRVTDGRFSDSGRLVVRYYVNQ